MKNNKEQNENQEHSMKEYSVNEIANALEVLTSYLEGFACIEIIHGVAKLEYGSIEAGEMGSDYFKLSDEKSKKRLERFMSNYKSHLDWIRSFKEERKREELPKKT
jgi:hypothetical protein